MPATAPEESGPDAAAPAASTTGGSAPARTGPAGRSPRGPLAWYRAKHPGSSLPHMLFYTVCRFTAVTILRMLYRVRVRDGDRVPATGPVLVIANHQSYYDPPLVGGYLTHRHFDFIARAGLFRIKPLAALIRPLNTIPISEAGGDTAAMKEALRRLGMGRAVVLFPEGSRSPDGAMRPFKRGISLLVKRAKCPVIPAAVEGAHDAFPRGSKPRGFGPRIAVAYGHAIPHAELMKDGPDAALRRLEQEVDALRLSLRRDIRERTDNRWPTPGPADLPFAGGGADDDAADV